MKNKDSGGPAFPFSTGGMYQPHVDGMPRRDYFIAHAPAEPWSWFVPDTPAPPCLPARPDTKTFTPAERDEFLQWRSAPEFQSTHLTEPRILRYAGELAGYNKDANAHRIEYEKQLRLQWPVAWADAMLEQASK